MRHPRADNGAMSTFQSLSGAREADVHVGDIVEVRGEGPLMFVQEVLAGTARCAWVHLHGIGEGVFPLAALRRAPAPAASPRAGS